MEGSVGVLQLCDCYARFAAANQVVKRLQRLARCSDVYVLEI